MKKSDKNNQDNLALDQQIHRSLVKLGLVIPQTEEDVRLARIARSQMNLPAPPPSLMEPQKLLDRLTDEFDEPQEEGYAIEFASITLSALLKRLNDVGIDKKLLSRLVSKTVREKLVDRSSWKDISLIGEIISTISQIYGWTKEFILTLSAPLTFDGHAVSEARFKLPARANVQRLNAYTIYAHAVAMILLKATSHLPRQPLPGTAAEMRQAIKRRYGTVTFEHALRYVWSLGIPVLPLNDSGAFHGACWRVNFRNVIALKQKIRSLDRWLFDLIHELVHAGENPDEPNLSQIEDDLTLDERRNSIEEQEANNVAGDVTLNGRAEELAQQCVREANRNAAWLKRVIPTIAARAQVSSGALANYLAYRLSQSGNDNFWGTATVLQDTSIDPWRIARKVLLEYIDLSKLDEFERNLLAQALEEEAD